MNAKLLQSILLAAGLALTMPLLADDGKNPVLNCDEISQQHGDVQQDRKRDQSCAEPMRSQIEDGDLPVSGEKSRNRERSNNPAASPVASPTPSGRGGR